MQARSLMLEFPSPNNCGKGIKAQEVGEVSVMMMAGCYKKESNKQFKAEKRKKEELAAKLKRQKKEEQESASLLE